MSPQKAEPDSPGPRHSLWYKDAIVYELHVRTFHDSDGDGIGDFAGLTEKLDYVQDLGVTAIWLLPFYPSPLRDDGYDIAHYMDVHPDCGTLRDFKIFLRESHRRGLRVIIELVLNHTSDQHPWFQRARRAPPGSSARNFYVWSDTPELYKEARIIFEDFEPSNWTWDSVASAYYWHRFYSHQPDLNYRNPAVLRAIIQVLDFWLGLGVDGVRLDAVPYLIEAEGTSSENLPGTHAVLKRLRREGDEAHMAFHFPLMPRLFMAIRQEDRFPIVDVLAQTPAIPDSCQWALFLRNHDELTLEMVTEEERLFMYHVYTSDRQARINLGIRRRLAPLLGNDRRKIELMTALLFSFPGTPVIYYGDEIGMGDNIFLGDRNGIRTPMQWSGERNAGFSSADPQRLCLPLIVDYEYHHQTVHVEAQQRNGHSLLSWIKRLLALRKRSRAFGRGTLEFRHPHNRSVLVFIRRWQNEAILIAANLSRFDQYVEIDLSGFEHAVPTELTSRNPFPPIGTVPYPLTLAPHAFLWLALEREPTDEVASAVPIVVHNSWEGLITGKERNALEGTLPGYLRSCPWFTERRRRILSTSILEAIPIDGRTSGFFFLTLVRVEYAEREPDMYVLPIGWAIGSQAEEIRERQSGRIITGAAVTSRHGIVEGIVYDAIADAACARALLSIVVGQRHASGMKGNVATVRTPAFRSVKRWRTAAAGTALLAEELSNASLIYGEVVVLKVFRKVSEGVHPEFAIGDFLTRRRFRHAPMTLGVLEYRLRRREPVALAVLQRFIPNKGDGWQHTLSALREYRDEVQGRSAPESGLSLSPAALLEASERELTAEATERLHSYLPIPRLIGQRTAELHRTLATATGYSYLTPEPFTQFYQRSMYQSARGLTYTVLEKLRGYLPRLPRDLRADAERVTAGEAELLARFGQVLNSKLTATRIACHGNYHLQQVLRTGDDFTIIDFEGEPLRPLFERRVKRTPLLDVASMVRSFHYAAQFALPEPEMSEWSLFWRYWVAAAFLRAYFSNVDPRLIPSAPDEFRLLFEISLLERALYELGYELDHRPDWIGIPLRDVRDLLEGPRTPKRIG